MNNSIESVFPPASKTLSLENKVAVWPIRGAAMVNSVEENVSVVGSNISAVPATSPPAMSTVPSLSRVAVCPARAAPIVAESTRKAAPGFAGSKISAELSGPVALVPPAIRTRPLGKSVAV